MLIVDYFCSYWPLAMKDNQHSLLMVVLLVQIGTDFLEESITEFDDLVQSVDVAAFNKV